MTGYNLLSSSLLSLTLLAACHEAPDSVPDSVRSSTTEDPAIDISPDLAKRFAQTSLDADHREAVIITLAPGTDTQSLEAAGMHVEHVMKNSPIVTGSLNADAFQKVSSLEGVERIEQDGEMKALDP